MSPSQPRPCVRHPKLKFVCARRWGARPAEGAADKRETKEEQRRQKKLSTAMALARAELASGWVRGDIFFHICTHSSKLPSSFLSILALDGTVCVHMRRICMPRHHNFTGNSEEYFTKSLGHAHPCLCICMKSSCLKMISTLINLRSGLLRGG